MTDIESTSSAPISPRASTMITRLITSKRFTDIVDRLISRKLIVFITATVLLQLDSLTGAEWMMVAMAYLGMQGVLDYKKAE